MRQQKLYYKKFYKNKGNWIPIFVFVLAILLVLIMNTRVGEDRNLAGMEKKEIALNKVALTLNEQREKSAQTEKEQADYNEGKELSKARIAKQQRIVDLYDNESWSEAYKIKINLIKESYGLYTGDTPDSPELRESIYRQIAIYTKLAELDIKSDQEDMETQGTTFLYRILANFFPVLFVIILCFTLNTVFTDRFYNNIDRSLLLPQKNVTGTYQRLLFGILVAFALYVMTCLIAYLPASVISGAGSFEYPIVINTNAGITTEPVGSLIVQVIVLQFLAIIIAVLMIDLVSKLFKRLMPTLFISLLILIAPVLAVGKMEPMSQWAHLLPGTYFNATAVVDNSLAILCDNGNISFINGVTTLGVMLFVLLILDFGIDGYHSRAVTLNTK
ncbi:hypothetical protein HB943_15815 [Listeria weihenstephanensis]|uniref:Uncharacterized protein n=1 Tax=Listeria weihenstephanensis TaxID=1006155 RepID=A0A841ZB36_9LIST|nr:hypothetical protein [Listeria weihenstephanensis]MBC1502069.1 hypothetical protein [Listeria weihenstephanensis]